MFRASARRRRRTLVARFWSASRSLRTDIWVRFSRCCKSPAKRCAHTFFLGTLCETPTFCLGSCPPALIVHLTKD